MSGTTAAPTPGQPLEKLLARVRDRADFPAAGKVIHELHAATRREHCATLDIVRLILDDPGLSSKMLRVVNSAFYRRGQEAVSTITRAVVVLGFETIRDVATGIALIDELLRSGHSSRFVREGLGRALHCALMAQQLSARAGYPTPEEAYLLGLFADWGTLWTAAHFPEEFARAQALHSTGGITLDEAIERVLGVPPRIVAAGVLEHWHFPPAYSAFFRAPQPTGHLNRAAPESKLFAVVGLAADYAGGTQDEGKALRARWTALFESPGEIFADATRVARKAWTDHARAFGLTGIPAPPEVAAEQPAIAAARAEEPSAPEATAPAPVQPPAEDDTPMADAQASLAIVGEITRAMLEGADLNQVLAMVLEGIARCGGFDVVFLALLDTSRQHLLGRLGYGEQVRTALRDLNVVLQANAGPLAEAVTTSRGILVPSGSPAPQFSTVRSFVVEPLVVRGRAIGAIVAGRTRGSEAGVREQESVRLFCTQAALALDRAAR